MAHFPEFVFEQIAQSANGQMFVHCWPLTEGVSPSRQIKQNPFSPYKKQFLSKHCELSTEAVNPVAQAEQVFGVP